MLKIKTINILSYLGAFLIIESLSFLASGNSSLTVIIFGLLVAFAWGLSWYRLELGLLLVLGELFIGSMGHLFVLPVGSFNISLRLALWLGVMIPFIVKFIWQLIKHRQQSSFYLAFQNFSFRKQFLVLAGFVLVGLLNAVFRGQAPGFIFQDFNAWLYFFLLLPLIIIFSRDNSQDFFRRLQEIFLAGVIFLSLKTLFFLFVFTHNLAIAPEIYTWLRRTLMAEITPTLSSWPRIFIQGQIFSGVAFFLALSQISRSKLNWRTVLLAAISLSTLLISFSRSFWVATIITLIFSLIFAGVSVSWRQAGKMFLAFCLSAIIGFSFIYLTAIFPYPTPGKFSADFAARLKNNGEPALASRWSLLPVLAREIVREPVLGQGFGATVTYYSQDPRVLASSPSGEYTTFAFEWGYLDLWLKLGILGLGAYLFVIFSLLRAGLKKPGPLVFGLGASLIFLAITNLFTPYLNHPLGIGIIVLSSCLIRQDRVY